jgi:small-conductance mechanosensitive channel
MHLRKHLPLRVRLRWSSLFLAVALLIGILSGRNIGIAQSGEQLDSNAVLDHLNRVISWYRRATTIIQPPGLPLDPIYQSNLEKMAGQAVRLAIQAAKATAALIPATGAPGGGATVVIASGQDLQKLQNDINANIGALQAQIRDLGQQIAQAPRSKVADLSARRDQLQGELELDNARIQALQQLTTFVDLNGENSQKDLLGKINELERSVPELTSDGIPAAKPNPAQSAAAKSQGLIGKAILLYDEIESIHEMKQLANETNAIRASADALRKPLQMLMRATLQQGRQLANTSVTPPTPQAATAPATAGRTAPAAATSPAPSIATRQQFDAVTTRFKQLASAAVPVSQEIILLDQSQSTLKQWDEYIDRESRSTLHAIIFQISSIALALGVVWLLSEMWRRVTFRYVRDARRRRQFLVLRRVVVGFCMGLVLILGFVTEFSSLATFAGFITAGLAVGLQTILLSVAAYFFLVGRWGIRVGDRISVAGVTGDVVDVGLVRLYMMELAGTGIDLFPTGRIVVLANSVLFQATMPLFKQVPGTEFTWHEVAAALQSGANYGLVEAKLLEAVSAVYSEYRPELERQHGNVERSLDIPIRMPEPQGRLQLAEAGIEYAVRYPVSLNGVTETDEKVTKKILEVIDKTSELKTAIAGVPKIRAAVKS